MTKFQRTAACAMLSATLAWAWHDPVHARITRAAFASLPAAMQQPWKPQAQRLAVEFSLYPDRYHNAPEEERAVMRRYCEVRGRAIHNVTWNRQQDLESLQYLNSGVASSMRAGDVDAAMKFAGVLAHLLEDSTCPAHSLTPMDSPLSLLKELLPPPEELQKIQLHTVIEHSSPEFDLGSREPRQESPERLLDRCYNIIRNNRAHLIDLVKLVYAGDEAGIDRYRLESARAGAELLADAYYSALSN
jgi:hypothetical protein